MRGEQTRELQLDQSIENRARAISQRVDSFCERSGSPGSDHRRLVAEELREDEEITRRARYLSNLVDTFLAGDTVLR